MWGRLIAGVAFALGAAAPRVALAQAAHPLAAGPIEAGTFDIRLGVEATHFSVDRAATAPIAFVERLRTTTFDFPIDLGYAAAPWIAFEGRVAVRIVDTSPSYGADGAAAAPPGVHPKDETIAGPTDLWLIARAVATRGGLTATARAGATVPIGKTEPAAFALESEGKTTQHAQFGAGVPRLIASGAALFERRRFALELDAFGLFSVADDDRGYRAPTQLAARAALWIPVRERLRLLLAVDAAGEADARWFGVPSFDEPGHAELSVGGGLAWTFAAPWVLDLSVRGTAAELLPSSGHSTPGSATLGVGTRFELPGNR